MAVRVDFLNVGADLSSHLGTCPKKRIIRGCRSVLGQPQNRTGQVSIVRSRAAELVVARRRGKWPVREVLELPPTAHVANDHVQVAVRPEAQDAAIVISPWDAVG